MCLDRGHHAPADAWLRASGVRRPVEIGHPTQRALRVLPERRRGSSVQRPGEPDDRPDTAGFRPGPQRRAAAGGRCPHVREPSAAAGDGDRAGVGVKAGSVVADRDPDAIGFGGQLDAGRRGRSVANDVLQRQLDDEIGGSLDVPRRAPARSCGTRHGSVGALGHIDADPHIRAFLGPLGEPLDGRQQSELIERDRASIERESIDLRQARRARRRPIAPESRPARLRATPAARQGRGRHGARRRCAIARCRQHAGPVGRQVRSRRRRCARRPWQGRSCREAARRRRSVGEASSRSSPGGSKVTDDPQHDEPEDDRSRARVTKTMFPSGAVASDEPSSAVTITQPHVATTTAIATTPSARTQSAEIRDGSVA